MTNVNISITLYVKLFKTDRTDVIYYLFWILSKAGTIIDIQGVYNLYREGDKM